MTYGLVGEKLSHSYSKIIHEKLGAYAYELMPTAKDDLEDLITARSFDGLNVTIPYKKTVMPLCDVVDPIAESIGAVNTLYFRDGRLHGTNTDYDGFMWMIARADISLSGKKVLICGSGGASLMVQKAAADLGAARITVASRSASDRTACCCSDKYTDCCSDSTADSCRNEHAAGFSGPAVTPTFVKYEDIPDDTEVVVNTTPLGTYPGNGRKPLDLAGSCSCEAVIDLIYNPFKSALLLQAEDMGIKYTNGLPMLTAQATRAAEYFTGSAAGEFSRRNEDILAELIAELRNISLIGMPGSGKTVLGTLLAEKTGKEFTDSDEEVIRISGRTAEEIIRTDGEPAFRSLESAAIAALGKENSQVIATGGGAATRSENLAALRQNGIIIYIRRPLEDLALDGRPLSRDAAALKEMYKKRAPLYEEHADIIVENVGEPADAVKAILKKLHSM